MEKETMNYKDYSEALNALWNRYQNENKCSEEFAEVLEKLKETLKLGIGICRDYKPNVDLLWMGINPSCTDNKRIEHPFSTLKKLLKRMSFAKVIGKRLRESLWDVSAQKNI